MARRFWFFAGAMLVVTGIAVTLGWSTTAVVDQVEEDTALVTVEGLFGRHGAGAGRKLVPVPLSELPRNARREGAVISVRGWMPLFSGWSVWVGRHLTEEEAERRERVQAALARLVARSAAGNTGGRASSFVHQPVKQAPDTGFGLPARLRIDRQRKVEDVPFPSARGEEGGG